MWIVANTAGAVIGAFITSAVTGGLFTSEPIYGSTIETFIREAANGLILGACIGWVEWLVLNSYMFNSPGWVWATSGGWALGFLIVVVLQNYIDADINSISAEGFAAILGTVIGLCQCVAIRGRVQRAWIWPLAPIAAWIASFATVPIISPIVYGKSTSELLRTVLGSIWLFGILEIVTGLALLWLLRHPKLEVVSDIQPNGMSSEV